MGSHVAEELVRRGHQVTALVQYNSFNYEGWLATIEPETYANLEVVAGDIRDAGFIRDVTAKQDRIVHLAALIAIPYSYFAPASYLETNALGTLNVLEASRVNDVARVVHTSTSEVYGTAQYVPIDEKHPLAGQSPYSASKIAADQVAFSYWSSFSVPVTTIRPFNTYGPRQSQRAFIPSVMVQLLAGATELRLGSLDPTRDLTFVHDTARGFADALESDGGLGEVFNVGSGFEISMRDVVAMACEISGQSPEITADSERIRPADSEVERLWSDSSKMLDTFGWQPRLSGREGLYEGLETTYRWLKDNHGRVDYDASKYVV